MASYESFAKVYDELMDNVPYDTWTEHLIRDLKEYDITDGLICELGCGTGNVTTRLSKAGYDMIGVDDAEEMLSVAREKQDSEQILYLQQDMRSFELYGTVRAVVSICDCMNYLLEEEDLLKTFQLVNNYLDPDGIFIFDFNTIYKYKEVMGDTVIAENREDCSFIWENYYDVEEEINEYDLTIFVQTQEDLFQRFTETHLQRGYTLEQMQEILQNCPEAHIKVAGISVLGVNGIKSRIKIPAYGKYLRRLILKNRLEGKVRVLGNLSAEEMKREYLSAQIFVCPSAVENSPNSVAEGQLLGVPVAASRTGGITDVVKDGVSGLLFEKGNVHELAACVSRILTDKQLAKELSASERETAAKLYNGENNYQKLIEIYQSIE